MTSLQLAGFIASIFIGVSLGLIGGGGSILTLPVLVYLLGINPVLSTTYSLFIVGTTALVGSASYMRLRQVDYKVALVFSIPSFLTFYLSRMYLVPAIPDPVYMSGDFSLSKNVALMIFFALIMLMASLSMIRNSQTRAVQASEQRHYNWLLLLLDGALVGILTGIIGAGGGFLIIPALVLLARLPMKIAIGTSLLIIGSNALIGFGESLTTFSINWPFLFEITGLSVAGIFVGTYLTRFIQGYKLKRGFGYFVLIMGLYIIVKETLS